MSVTTSQTPARKAKSRDSAQAASISLAIEVGGLGKGTILSQLDEPSWTRWSRYLAKRKRPAPLAHLARTHALEPLSWGTTQTDNASDATELVAQLQRWLLTSRPSDGRLAEIADAWLKETSSRTASFELSLESLAWCHCLPTLAAELPAPLWCRLLQQLLEICHDATAIDCQHSPLAQQLLAGELPLTLAWILPEISACASLAKTARTLLSDGIMDLLDEGLPRGQHLPIAQPLLACWTRSALIGEALKKASFRSGAQDQYRNFVRHTVCLSRPDGSLMLTPAGDASKEGLLDAALAVVDDDFATASAEALFFGQSPPLNGKRRLLLPSAVHSEWSELAVLRAHWSKNSPALTVNYSGGEIASELMSQQRIVWSGRCDPHVRINGALAGKVERWEEVCWFTDDDVHYLEVEAEIGSGWKVQRQFLLARTDAVLFIADAIVGPTSATIDYSCTWPTPAQVAFSPAVETCEGTLHAGTRRLANVVPLSLPEWRSDGRRSGSLQSNDGGLCLQVSRPAQRLYVPLMLDLEPWRIKRELTWRQLAVGHNLVPQTPDVAVGYRVQFYKQHWLIYRSLAERASRTVLGQNIYSEFVFSRFNRGGDSETLIEIE